ncbi:uncharacterized protein [Acropora muricata]|uniref:uncharacterized protein n=1 Tax=Acropora muricata TaxID=159855 RepID=UPI0034E58C98
MSFASAMAASVVAKTLNDPAVFQEWPHDNQGADNGTPNQGASLLKSNRLSSAMASQSIIKENYGKRSLQRQNTDFPENDIDISKVVELLKREYNRRAEFSPLEWSKGMKLHVKEVYTKLRVVSRSKAGSSEIDVDDIFGSSAEDNDPLVLVEGNPGTGKPPSVSSLLTTGRTVQCLVIFLVSNLYFCSNAGT